MRRQSLDPADLILAHVGGMDTCARALKSAAALMADGAMERARTERYHGWSKPGAQELLTGSLEEAAAVVSSKGLNPQPVSGRQERLENLWNRFV